jgi:hypothetical protein
MGGSDQREDDGKRLERTSFRVALAIALLPIPISLLIAWGLGAPPWRPRSDRGAKAIVPTKPGRPAHPARFEHP